MGIMEAFILLDAIMNDRELSWVNNLELEGILFSARTITGTKRGSLGKMGGRQGLTCLLLLLTILLMLMGLSLVDEPNGVLLF